MSIIRRVSGAVRARFSDADSKSARMLGADEDAHAQSGSDVGEEMYSVSSGTARVVDGSSVNVAVARPRPEDTEHLRRKENVFFALFRKPQIEVQRVNPRIAASEWGEMNSLFISKLLVDPPPVITDDEGQVQLEEDRQSMTGVRLWRTVKLFQDEKFLISVAFLILILQTALGFYIPQLTRVFSEATFCAQGFKDVIERHQRGQCNFVNLFDNETVCVAAFNVGDLGSSKAFAPLLNGILYPTKCSNENPLDAESQCSCSGIQSDSPLQCPDTMPNCQPRTMCTACAVAGLTGYLGVNCCGDGEYDIFGTAPYKGFFLTGKGTYSGIDFWWQVSIYVLVIQLVLANVQEVAFFIGFTRAFASIRRKMMLNILMQDMGFFEERDSANLIGRLTNQIEQLQPLISFVPSMLSTVTRMCFFGYYLFRDAQFATLSMFSFLYLPVYFVYMEWVGKFWLKWQLPLQKAMMDMYSVLAENLQNVPTIKAFNGYKVASQSFVAQINRSARITIYTDIVSKVVDAAFNIVTEANSVGMTYLGASKVAGNTSKLPPILNQPMTLPTFQLFQQYSTSFAQDLKALRPNIQQLFQTLQISGSINVLLFRQAPLGGEASRLHFSVFVDLLHNLTLVIPQTTLGSGLALENVQGEFQFHNVTFLYPSRPNQTILKNLSLTLPARKLTCIMGPSGCGKSTVMSMLMRLYEPLRGKITLDDADISRISVTFLRSIIGLVQQEPVLFSWSLRDNLKYGKPDATEEELQKAITDSGAAEIVAKLPEGLETEMSATFSNLSVGQRQRLVIARAFLRDAPILLLDEPTSALDVRSEELVTEAIGRLRIGRTCVMITHRISTARDADLVVVMNEGSVAEAGNPVELLRNEGSLFKAYMDQNLQINAENAAAMVLDNDGAEQQEYTGE